MKSSLFPSSVPSEQGQLQEQWEWVCPYCSPSHLAIANHYVHGIMEACVGGQKVSTSTLTDTHVSTTDQLSLTGLQINTFVFKFWLKPILKIPSLKREQQLKRRAGITQPETTVGSFPFHWEMFSLFLKKVRVDSMFAGTCKETTGSHPSCHAPAIGGHSKATVQNILSRECNIRGSVQ